MKIHRALRGDTGALMRGLGVLVWLWIAGCSQAVPVPVPELATTEHVRRLLRCEVALPAIDEASCEQPPDGQRPARPETLREFLERYSADVGKTTAMRRPLDAAMRKLLAVLADAGSLKVGDFPRKVGGLPGPAREVRVLTAVDSRDPTPPAVSLAFRFEGFWWAFWQRRRGGDAYDRLIVFPEAALKRSPLVR